MTSETHAGGGTKWINYDAAGNDTLVTTPREYPIKQKFDAAGRLIRRIVPEVFYPASACSLAIEFEYCNYSFPTIEGTNLCIAADSQYFAYDGAGNLATAANNWAKSLRSYAPSGVMTGETQYVRTYDTESADPCGGGDRHATIEGLYTSEFFHVYAVGSTFDLAGRRTSMTLPNAGYGGLCYPTNCVQAYKYDAVTGTLDTLVHPMDSAYVVGTGTTIFTYDAQGRLTQTKHAAVSANLVSTLTYDADGRVVGREGPNHQDSLAYDAAGRIVGGLVPGMPLHFGYSGMGALNWAEGASPEITAEEVWTDALGTRLKIADVDLHDMVDRTRLNVTDPYTGRLSQVTLSAANNTWYDYHFEQGYDASGNTISSWEFDTPSEGVYHLEEDRSYFSADEKLTYYNRTVGFWFTQNNIVGSFDEYRYDAFGRRVLTRTRKTGLCPSPCDAFIERTAYDGDQVVAEFRSSGKIGVAPEYLEGDGLVATGDDAKLYGRVYSFHAQGIDHPAYVVKQGQAWPGIGGVAPHANYQGAYAYGTFSNGGLCVAAGDYCPTWPGYNQGVFGSNPFAGTQNFTVWFGSLLRGRTDASGMTYLRNRYYDAGTGRFTQLDPIGLGGGLNLYGFAEGDPVNFSDPFGLCPEWKTRIPCVSPIASPMRPAHSPEPSGVGGSEFGWTRSQGKQFHNGFDHAAAAGTAIVAPGDATVTAGWSETGGNFLVMDLGNGASVTVLHAEGFDAGLEVGKSMKVSAGTHVGRVGRTGNAATSPRETHGHVITRNGGKVCNPRDFFSKDGGGGSCQ